MLTIYYIICILYFFLLCDFVFLNMFQIFGICLAQNLVSDVRAVKANWWPFAEGDSDRWQWPDYGRELIVNQHSLHITELGISALFTLQMLYVSWLYKMDCPSVFFFFFCGSLSENKLTIQKELKVRCHIEIKLSVILQLSLDRMLFSFALIKTFTRLSSVLVNNVKWRVFSLTCGWLSFRETHESTTETLNRGAMN